MILATDIAGTNACLGLFELEGPILRNATIRRYPSRGHASLEELVERFLAEVGRSVETACFAVAGPGNEGRAVLTNLGWTDDARRLAGAALLNAARLINDLEGIAHASTNSRTPTWCSSTLRSWLAWDVFLLDYFGLRKLSASSPATCTMSWSSGIVGRPR